jgi:hypothetical protein
MMQPSRHVVRTCGIPEEVIDEAYGPSSNARQRTLEALRKPRELCWENRLSRRQLGPALEDVGIYAPRGA